MIEETFTDFMIRSMENEDSVSQALLVVRRADGTTGYRSFKQDCMDTLGMLRFTALSVEHDLVESWNQ